MIDEYDRFVRAKLGKALPHGFEPTAMNGALFAWQRHVVEWAIRQGRCALFEDCGLGKTLQQLEWADQVAVHTHAPVLILTPLAVASQTIAEGKRFGINARIVRHKEDVQEGINVTNYERLSVLEPDVFAGVVLDESSILKNFTGKTRIALTEAFAATPYRLCCTATPAPNDYMEFGQHAEFLGVCSSGQMLATFFINDTAHTGDWRLKRHAEAEFWRWMASWAACVSKPSDIGFSDNGYVLPPLNLQTVTVDVDEGEAISDGELIRSATLSATTMHREMRLTCSDRVRACAELVASNREPWIVWCNTNYEADELCRAIPEAIEVRGSDRTEDKERNLRRFTERKARVIVTKPGIAGFGLNWQHCCNVLFVGLSYSFEEFYQALRRSYRFGQAQEVNAYIIQARTEEPILMSVRRKIEQHRLMQERMKLAAIAFRENEKKQMSMNNTIVSESGDDWTLYHGDCVRVARTLPAESVHLSIFSPPFADLFTYSDDVQDMGNCTSVEEFMRQFAFLIDELMRLTMAGRECAVHCCDLLSKKWKDGRIEFQDFSGLIAGAFRSRGWLFHSRITIWKSPVIEMQRTKAHGLLYKTLCKDSSCARVGAADYLLVFRKPGENREPIRHSPDSLPLSVWQELASPVWMTIDQGKVLNGQMARKQEDERHICPLQLDVIERAVRLWSNPRDVIFSPFAGIGSEGYQALRMGRRFIGSELKDSYFRVACRYLKSATAQLDFELLPRC